MYEVTFNPRQKGPAYAFTIKASSKDEALAVATQWLAQSGERTSAYKAPKVKNIA